MAAKKRSGRIAKRVAKSSSGRIGNRVPESWAGLVHEAEQRGYLEIADGRIKYNCAQQREENYSDPEEQVRAGIYAWLVLEKEYEAAAIKIEVSVPRRTPSDFADIVVYEDSSCRTPYLVVEAKRPGISRSDYVQATEQAFGNANSLRDTTFALVDCGAESTLYAVSGFPHDERDENLIGSRDDLPQSYGAVPEFALLAGQPAHDIAPATSQDTERCVRRAHSLIWAGGKRDPLKAFDEWSKLLFAKIYDERHTPNGEPRRFQVGRGESDVKTGNRIRRLYSDAQREDASIFSSALDLPDDKIAQVVRTIQGIGFTLMDVDSLGDAFESFFGSVFRGGLGQYFTRRELVRFVCALLKPTDRDKILDPTAGSGGFLLESLIQVWHYIDASYGGQPEQERRRYDFAQNNLYGIEIHQILGAICQTNLMLHKDGHTNIEVDRSCLDLVFDNPALNPERPVFTLALGNPPFGDSVEEGDRDKLGQNRLANFELPAGKSIASEIVVLERAIKWLVPGVGRLGMVVPDGLLNNPGESSRCPAFRRFLFRNMQVLAIVSLPDYAFRKSGAQNKTSLLFARRFSANEKARIDEFVGVGEGMTVEEEEAAISEALAANDYRVFLAEADNVGYSSAGAVSPLNDLYRAQGRTVGAPQDTILGQYRVFESAPDAYTGAERPSCLSTDASSLFDAHPSHRIDPKYHTFKHVEELPAPEGLRVFTLGELLEEREEFTVPADDPDTMYKTITLTQEGELEPREAGKGNNPPDWRGEYFREGQKWKVVRAGGVFYSRIDLWKGSIGVVPPDFDGAIATNEFPVYYVRDEHAENVDVRYLKLLLRSHYFQRAIRAITTGHSNRRRTPEDDFRSLRVFLPPIEIQLAIVESIEAVDEDLAASKRVRQQRLATLDDALVQNLTLGEVQAALYGRLPDEDVD